MAIKYLGGNRIIGLSSDTKPASNNNTGTTFLETNTDDLYMWDGDSWNIVAGNSIAQTFSNKSFTSAGIEVVEGSAPSAPDSGLGVIYAKSDNKLYFKNDANVEYNLTEAASGTALEGLTDTNITSPADGAVLVYDTGTSRWRDYLLSGVATMNDVGAMTLAAGAVTDLSATTTVSNSNDFVIMYDASASGVRKVTVGNIVAGGVSSDTLSLLNDTTIASVASANVLIYDGTDSWDNKAISGDITLGADGAVAIASGVVVNADIHAAADIAISKTALVAGTGITLATNTLNVDVAQTHITSVGPLAGTLTVSGILDVKNAGTASVVRLYCEVSNAHYAELKSDAHSAYSGNVTLTLPVATGTLIGTGNLTAIVTTGALNAGSITSGFGAIDTGSSNITTTGTVSAGNLTVTGTTTTVNSSVLTVVDPIIHLQTASGGGALGSDTNKDVGLAMQYYSGSAKTAFLGFDDSAAKLTFIPDATLSSEVVSGSVGTLVANLEGNVSGGAYTGTVINDDYIDTINNANKVALTALDIDGGTAIGAAIVDADLFIVDDGGGGTNRKVAASVLKTYAAGDAADQAFAIAMAVAL